MQSTSSPPSRRIDPRVAAEARAEAARRGRLRHLLHSSQREIYDALRANQSSPARWTQVVSEIARKWGKTWLWLAYFAEECIRHPGERFVFGAPTYVQLREFAFPIMREIETVLPVDVRPKFHEQKSHWEFPNGAWTHLFAADDISSAKRGRGPKARAAVFDEAAHVSPEVLGYVLTQVLKPSLMLCDEPLLILSSTPADEPEHQFTQIAEIAEAEGSYFRRTIYDNPMLSPARIERLIAENARDSGLSVEDYKRTPGFRREYMAERAIETSLVVVPEWETKRSALRQAVPRPEYFNGMTVLDFGGADPHAALFGYWHFPLAKWVIEHELLMREHQNSAELAKAIKDREREAWGVDKWNGALRAGTENPTETLTENLPEWMTDLLTADAPEQPFSRWADNDLQLVHDLYDLHGLAFIPTSKDDLELQVNNFRVAVSAEQFLLHPRCIHADRHLRTTTWANHRRREFKRTAAGEHGDLVATCIYGQRNLDKRNPFPPGYALPVGVNIGARVRAKTDAGDFGSDMLGATALGRKLLRSRR